MDARTWALAKSILADAAALPAPDRARFLEERCPEPALRRELLAMLASPAPLSGLIADRGLIKGARLGHYVIESLLGRGGMGEVYRARDSRLGRDVAIKVLPVEVSQDPDRLRRFEREAQMVGALNHPHIAAIYGLERVDTTTFLVLELVAGESLAERLEKGPLKLEEALRVAIQIADGLDAAHHAGIVHRDLKPGNVMLGKAGAKLLDFGLAKSSLSADSASSLTEASDLTAPGTIMGTLPYMAPEQIEGKHVDARSDIFSFGCVLYQMLGGRAPFEGATTAKLVAAILERDPPELAGLQPLVPPALERVVRRCLAKEPGARWQTVTDLLAELRWIADGGYVLGVQPVMHRNPRWRAMRLVALGAVVACLVGAFAWLRPDVSPSPSMHMFIVPPLGQKIADHGLAFSPDGTKLAFRGFSTSDAWGAGTALWLYSIADGRSTAVPNSDISFQPFFSPDGRSLGFCTNWDKVQTVNLSSGSIVTAATGGCFIGSWNASGTIVFSRRGAIYEVPASGGMPAAVLERRADLAFDQPVFLPDGRHFLVEGRSSNKDAAGMYVADLEHHDVRLLLRDVVAAKFTAPGFIFYRRAPSVGVLLAQRFDTRTLSLSGTPTVLASGVLNFAVNAQMIAYSVAGDFSQELLWIGRDGTILKRIESPSKGSAPYHPRFSPDGSRLAYEVWGAKPGIWVHDLRRDVTTPITSGADQYPFWSPDGKELVFTRSYRELRRTLATGSGDGQVIATGPDIFPRDWSPDGREIVYSLGDGDMGVARLSPQSQRSLLASASFDTWDAQFSADGKWLAFDSNEAGGNDVYVVSYPDLATKIKVSIGGGTEPRWRADGRELFYLDPNRRMMSVPVAHEGNTLGFSKATALFQTNIVNAIELSYDVSPDGRTFVVTVPTATGTANPLHVVTNWTGLLQK